MNRVFRSLMLSVFLIGCGDSSDGPPQVRQAEFSTMQACLKSVPADAGLSIKDVVVDKPDAVSGYLVGGRFFACQKKQSGTKGTYYLGWYNLE